MNRDIGGPRSVVAHVRDPTERVPPYPLKPSNSQTPRRRTTLHRTCFQSSWPYDGLA
jgi:hypothetical protein